MKTDVSVIIPNFNGEDYIKNCLDSLEDQSFNGAMEIIVVDDCSTDTSKTILRNNKRIKLLENDKNSGFDWSVNQGIKASKGQFCLLLNNDVVLEKDFVKNIYKSIQNKPKSFSVSSKMIRYYERDKIDDTGDFYTVLGWAYKRGDGKDQSRYEKATEIFSTCAGAGIYRRSVLEEIGLFDEQFFAYLEDIDIAYRAKIYGYKNYYEPKAICYHIGSATTAEGQKYSPFKVTISARNNIYVIYKNMPIVQWLLNSPFLAVGFFVKYLLFLKRGYGKNYRQGIKQGFTSLNEIKKVPFRLKHLKNYLGLEWTLILNTIRFVLNKLI